MWGGGEEHHQIWRAQMYDELAIFLFAPSPPPLPPPTRIQTLSLTEQWRNQPK